MKDMKDIWKIGREIGGGRGAKGLLTIPQVGLAESMPRFAR